MFFVFLAKYGKMMKVLLLFVQFQESVMILSPKVTRTGGGSKVLFSGC